MKKALITGITGQDGSYLAELLLQKGYDVYGIIRRSSNFNTQRVDHLFRDIHSPNRHFHLVYGDITDYNSLSRIIWDIMPDEIYHLGAQSHVRVSFDIPTYTAESVGLSTLYILEVLRSIKEKTETSIKFYQASSSEMFGKVQEIPQNEETPFYPRSPYGDAKVFGFWSTVNYRESYNLFACNGILFNHESPRRGGTFVTKKVVDGLVHITQGKQETLYIGNLEAKRDWGYAKEYVEAMWLMLQADIPEDYVIATGETHSVRELIETTADVLGMSIKWKGSGLQEVGIDAKTGNTIIRIDPKYFRPTEVDLLIGDATKAKKQLGWTPTVTFRELIEIMVSEKKHNTNV